MSTITPPPTTELNGVVARNVRRHLRRADVPQNRLAVAVALGPDELSARMTGRQVFDVDDLALIADQLGITPSDLLADGEDG
jgi:hypothetical protein